MTDAPKNARLRTPVRRPPVDPFARHREGPLQESALRVCSAYGDAKRAHLRQADSASLTLCGRPVDATYADEEAETVAAGGKHGCPGCMKRAHPGERAAAACRAVQVVARRKPEKKS